jgi:enoyl-CoA hydratase/carnithine racemase
MELKVLGYQVDRGIAVCTLNRPQRLNAWTNRMAAEYRWALATADQDPAVRVVVVTGAGRGFCAGGDAEALAGVAGGRPYEDPPEPLALTEPVRPDFDHLLTFHLGMAKPVIAAVNGPAAGIGFALMCFCDLRFAAAGAKLTTSFARLGLPAEHGVSWLLPRLIGPAHAADLLMSSRVVLAEEARDMGLVNRVCAPDDLMPETLDYARTLATETAPGAVAVIKAQLYDDLLGALDRSARRSVDLMHDMMLTPEFKEGVAALKEKRPPNFGPA